MFERFLSSSNIHEQFLPPLSESSLLEALLFLLTPNTVGFEQDDRHDNPSEGSSGTWHPPDTYQHTWHHWAPSACVPVLTPLQASSAHESETQVVGWWGLLVESSAYGRSTMKLGLLAPQFEPPSLRAPGPVVAAVLLLSLPDPQLCSLATPPLVLSLLTLPLFCRPPTRAQ